VKSPEDIQSRVAKLRNDGKLTRLGEGQFNEVYHITTESGEKSGKLLRVSKPIDTTTARTDRYSEQSQLMIEASRLDVGPNVYLEESAFFPDREYTALVLDHSGTSVASLGKQSLKAIQLRETMVDFAQKLGQLNGSNIAHRDLHAGNVLVEKQTSNVTFTDFGSSRRIVPQSLSSDNPVSDIRRDIGMMVEIFNKQLRPETIDSRLPRELREAYLQAFREGRDSATGRGPKPQIEVDAVEKILDKELRKLK
jgi:serine/threonine protein kinase